MAKIVKSAKSFLHIHTKKSLAYSLDITLSKPARDELKQHSEIHCIDCSLACVSPFIFNLQTGQGFYHSPFLQKLSSL